MVQVKGFWDVAVTLGGPAAGIVVGAAGLSYLQKYWPKNGNGNGNSGAKPVDFWRSEFRDIVNEGIRDLLMPLLAQQTEILRETKDVQRHMENALTRLITLAEVRDRRSGT